LDKLIEILKDEAETLSRDFKKASTLGEGTSQEIADFREHAFQDFLARFFPSPYRVVRVENLGDVDENNHFTSLSNSGRRFLWLGKRD